MRLRILTVKLALEGAFIALATLPAHAQQARVVTACGSLAPFGPVAVGGVAFPTIDTNGRLCLSGGGGGGGTITAGTTPTSGFTAGQLLMSDGSLTQVAPLYTQNLNAHSYLVPTGTNGLVLNGDSTGGYLLSYNYPTFNAGMTNAWAFKGSNVNVHNAAATSTAFRVYNTYTDPSNGEWGALDWQTTPNVLTIGTQANGTGALRPVQIVGTSVSVVALQSNGTQPTITGSGGTCATTTKVGGATAGTVVLSAVCASTNTIAFTGMPTVTNGYVCDAADRTTAGAGPFDEISTTTTGFTLKVRTTSSVANDVLQWKCIGY